MSFNYQHNHFIDCFTEVTRSNFTEKIFSFIITIEIINTFLKEILVVTIVMLSLLLC